MSEWQIKLFIDGACPMCSREGRFLKRMDKHGRLAIEDSSAANFDPAKYGISTDPDRLIHALLPDGTVLRGMEVFRQAYKQIGLGWLLAPTGWPLLRPIFDSLYSVFARNRKRIGRLIGPRCQNGLCD